MKTSISPNNGQEEAILQITALYVEQVQSGQKPTLSDYIVRYPEYKDAIVDFVAYYHALEEHLPQRKERLAVGETFSAISQFALEYVWQCVGLRGECWPYQMQTLFIRKDSQRLSLSYLASELDLSIDIVMQLEQRSIDPESIPLALSRHLAQLLQQPWHAIQAYFIADNQRGIVSKDRKVIQRVAERQEPYTAVPLAESVPRISFCQALQTSVQISEQQKAHWCAIAEREMV